MDLGLHGPPGAIAASLVALGRSSATKPVFTLPIAMEDRVMVQCRKKIAALLICPVVSTLNMSPIQLV